MCTMATLVKPFLCIAINLRPVARTYRFQCIVWHLLVQVIALSLQWLVRTLLLLVDERARTRRKRSINSRKCHMLVSAVHPLLRDIFITAVLKRD